MNGQATRSQLCELTGLSRATVSALVGELAERGLLVEESNAETGSTGRPVGVLSLDRSNGLGLGIDIGVRHVAVAVGDLGRNVYAERWRQAPVGHASSSGLEAVVREVKAALREAGADLDHLVGAVVGLAAPVSVQGGRIAEPKLLPGWAEGRLAGHLADALGVPVKLENTATLGALGEYVWGRAAGIPDLVYVKLASRVGAGLVINGSLYRGADGLAGEFGHLTLDPNGPPCRCGGRGCLELYAGGSAILRELGRKDAGDGIELLIDDALAGDRAVIDAVTRAARYLGQGLASLAKLLNPQRIVIGGEFSQLADLITDPVGEELTRSCFTSAASIEVSSLGRRASLLGALALVLTQPSRVHARTAVPRLPRGGGAAHQVLTFPTRNSLEVLRQARPDVSKPGSARSRHEQRERQQPRRPARDRPGGRSCPAAPPCSPPSARERSCPAPPTRRQRTPAAGSAAVTGASASVSANGTYTVTTASPAFTFTGTVGASATNISASTAGSDAVGAYHEIDFQYTAGGYPRTASIRTYDSLPVVLFGTTYVDNSDNVSPYYAFPAFTQRPSLTYSETFSADAPFGPYVFNTTGDPGFSPYLAFDSAGAYLISPASHFDTGVVKTVNGAFSSVISDGITTIPAGLNYRTALVYGAGPSAVFSHWGNALTGWSGKKRPAQNATVILAKLGYWTDHVYGYYYYSTQLPGVLQQVRTHWESLGLPMGYLQLDSWWYPKGPDASWTDSADGIYLYEADPTLFPDGLGAFQSSVGVPLVTHARWIDPSSPYYQEYDTSGAVVIDPAYWNNRMNYLAANGVVTYEQDWLGANAQPAFNLTSRGAFLGNMAAACSENQLDIQYCMTLPRDYLQSTLYDAVTNTRVSNDGFDRTQWDDFLYGSHLAASVGLWPWADVTTSAMTNCLLLQALSAGPVGVGDEIGAENVGNLQERRHGRRHARQAGQPDRPHRRDLPERRGRRRRRDGGRDHEHSRLDDRRVRLRVLAFQQRERRRFLRAVRSGRDRNGLRLQLLRQHRHHGRRQRQLTTSQVGYDGSYFLVVPVGASGIGFLGDAGKFVSLGSQRISSLSDNGTLKATVKFAAGDGPVTLHGYSPKAVTATATGGSITSNTYSTATQRFSLVLAPGSTGTASVTISA